LLADDGLKNSTFSSLLELVLKASYKHLIKILIIYTKAPSTKGMAILGKPNSMPSIQLTLLSSITSGMNIRMILYEIYH